MSKYTCWYIYANMRAGPITHKHTQKHRYAPVVPIQVASIALAAFPASTVGAAGPTGLLPAPSCQPAHFRQPATRAKIDRRYAKGGQQAASYCIPRVPPPSFIIQHHHYLYRGVSVRLAATSQRHHNDAPSKKATGHLRRWRYSLPQALALYHQHAQG
jgi:hypothetical protein